MPEKRLVLTRADLERRYTEGERDFRQVELRADTNPTGAKMVGAHLDGIKLVGANLSGADLCCETLTGARLRGIDLSHANLNGVQLGGADLAEANLSHACLANAYLGGANLRAADMSYADVVFAHLGYANLSDAKLTGADLTGTILSFANLTGATLAGVNFATPHLCYANFSFANLSGATLWRVDLSGANFNGADLSGATLEGATCNATIFARVNLAETLGLASINHQGPSSVGIDTIVLSGGQLPNAFLRGCGVPPGIIESQKGLFGRTAPLEGHACFVRFSRCAPDEEFAKRLHDRLHEAGVRAWLVPQEIDFARKHARLLAMLGRAAPRSMRPRSPVEKHIAESIRPSPVLLLVLSEESMASEWLAMDISKARNREQKEGRAVLLPIHLVGRNAIEAWECRDDADAGKDWASEIRERPVRDFANWRSPQAFEGAFARLLDDLRASAEK